MSNFFTGVALASNGTTSSSGILEALNSLIPGGLENLFVFAWELGGFIAFLIILWAGFQYTVHANDVAKQKRSKEMITEAAWGLGILATSYIIISVINPSLLEFKINLPPLQKINLPAEGRSSGPSNVGGLSQQLINGFSWPTLSSGWISSPFGPRGASVHHGIDIAVNMGAPVYAAETGKVIVASFDPDGYGNYIQIQHANGYTTLYGHCSELLVRVGDTVTKGEEIALAGSTGRSTGPHVHFEIALNGTRVNPLANPFNPAG
ncbi:MAG: peptidoglycan DD-metalloendopeptidase family protein [Patescibacteria group bacterium]|nr:peptidoglycan DD-metalloendopeptidase family protein [Patescibacteria group bacterium]MCL5262160.1 peptidoglycan DD-metalloendopeptidase family protein [Patescibacteria group bacterium]